MEDLLYAQMLTYRINSGIYLFGGPKSTEIS